ncbi:hypothetical protein Misp06_03542 [Microbulbifer sp. NBRC 101763]
MRVLRENGSEAASTKVHSIDRPVQRLVKFDWHGAHYKQLYT